MTLPDELIDEILCRLPVKYILRCRCVSKDWCSLIDSAAFVKKHLNRNIECNASSGIIISGGENFVLTDTESLYADEEVPVIELNDPLKTVLSGADFVGAANCLVCFCKNRWNDFIILNPSTRQYRKVPSMPSVPSMSRVFEYLFEIVEGSSCGFGYDHVNDDYKVVKITGFCDLVVMIYSLKCNYWTQIQNVPSNINLSKDLGMFTNGALHWLGIKDLCQPGFSYIIVGFDLGLQQFKEVPYPPDDGNFFVPSGGFLCICDNHSVPSGGSLCICDSCTYPRTKVWLINNYGAENPWYKAFSVEQHGALGSFGCIRPVAFSRNGKDVLLEVDSRKLVWYDPERKVAKNVRIHGIPIMFVSHLYRESLLPLAYNEPPHKALEDKKKKKQQKKSDDFLSKGFKLKLEDT